MAGPIASASFVAQASIALAAGHRFADAELEWRELRMTRGRPPAGSSPAAQQKLGLNRDATLSPRKGEGETLRERGRKRGRKRGRWTPARRLDKPPAISDARRMGPAFDHDAVD